MKQLVNAKGYKNFRDIEGLNCLGKTLNTRSNVLKEVRGKRESTGNKMSGLDTSGYDEHEQIMKTRQVSHLPDSVHERDDRIVDTTVDGIDDLNQSGELDLIINGD